MLTSLTLFALFAAPALAQVCTTDVFGVDLEAQINESTTGVGFVSTCCGYTSPSGSEYALIAGGGRVTVFDVSAPDTPQQVTTLPLGSSHGLATYQDKLYVGGLRITVIDLSQIDSGIFVPVAEILKRSEFPAIDATSGYLYTSRDLAIYDLNASLTNPPLVGAWPSVSGAEPIPTTYTSGPNAGRQIVFVGETGASSVVVLDVTDKQNIIEIERLSNPGTSTLTSGSLSTDRRYLYYADRQPPHRTFIFDVQDIDVPLYLTEFRSDQESPSDDLFVAGDLIYQCNFSSGLRVFDASDPVAPVEIAWYDTRPDFSTIAFQGLTDGYRFPGSGTVIGGDTNGEIFVWSVPGEVLHVDVVGGVPELIAPSGSSVTISIGERNVGDLQTGTEMLNFDDGTGSIQLPLVSLGGGQYQANLPSAPCGATARWSVEATTAGGWTYFSAGARASDPYSVLVADSQVTSVEHTMEADLGWTVGAPTDQATSGIWVRDDPIGTRAQPELDHTPDPASMCWVTGQGPIGGAAGVNDVDGGGTTLFSPVLDLSGLIEPAVGYWRWYSNCGGNSPGADTFEVSASANGTQWTLIERIGPDGDGTHGGWRYHSFRPTDFPLLAGSTQIQLRFVASDLDDPSLVEAAIDDLRIYDAVCGLGSTYCVANPNSLGEVGRLSAAGSALATDNDLTLTASRLPLNATGYFLASQGRGFVPNPAGSSGNYCLSGSVARFVIFAGNSGSTGTISAMPDLTAVPTTPFSSILAGETWYFQLWHRDFLAGPTSNFTEGFAIAFL